MSEYQPGEIVDIATKGARIERVTTEGFDSDAIRVALVVVHDNDGRPYYITLPLDWATVTVERRAPAEWPPQLGDLWRSEREPYFAVVIDDGPEVSLMNRGGEWFAADFILDAHGPLTLVYREGGERS